MISTITWSCDPVLGGFLGIGLRYYSLCWGLGFILGYLVMRYMFRRGSLDVKLVDSLLFYVLIGTLAGARLGHCLFYDWAYYSKHIFEIFLPFTISSVHGIHFTGYAGLASHGGAVGIIVSLILFNRKYHIPLLSLLDKLGVVAPLAGACIRIGNFFNSEIIGAASDAPWAVIFTRVDSVPRHPAQVYEALSYILIFAIVFVVYRCLYKTPELPKKISDNAVQRHGVVFGLAICLIFFARFIIEFCKEVQEPFEIGLRSSIGMDMGQLLSLPFIAAGIYFIVRGLRKK